jgi:hypothetical protein
MQNNINGLMQEIGEKEVLASAFDNVRKIFESRKWLMEGRGSYPYDDDRYKQEVRWLMDEFEKIYNETWRNIRTKTFEYKETLISEYKGDLKDENKYFKDIVLKFQELCLKEKPNLEEILHHSRAVKMGWNTYET